MNLKQTPESIETVPFLSGYALKTGIHVGHKFLRLSKTNFWHPLMAHYFLGIRHGISVLDPVQTQKCLLRAFYVIALLLKTKTVVLKKKENNHEKKQTTSSFSGTTEKSHSSFFKVVKKTKNRGVKNTHVLQKGHLLLVNTNPEFSRLCKNLSRLTLHESKKIDFSIFQKIDGKRLSYVHYKWVGGTLTNWKQVSKSVLTYAKFSERCEKFLYRNTLDFPRFKKIKECFHGLIRKKQSKVYLAFHEKPDVVFLMNPNENRHIIAEANKMHIPVIALVESNTCLKGISYPIPANAYSARFIYYCLKKILKLSTI